MDDNKFHAIGRISPRKEGYARVTGRERYVSDLSLPNMLHARVLRSPYPHAKIVSIDTREAEKLGAGDIKKPYTMQKLGKAIREILDKR